MSKDEILETISMISSQHLDVRTITMGISLLDCIGDTARETCERVYKKITDKAKNLVKVGNDIQSEFGVPIVNKRISVTPVSLITARTGGSIEVAKTLDKCAEEVGVDFIGGYSALVQKGMTDFEREFLYTIPQALACTSKMCSSVNVASTKTGINMDAVKIMGEIIKETSYLTREQGSIGCAKFVVFANAVEDNPFMAGAFHGVGEADVVINVGVSGPGVVKVALEQIKDGDLTQVAETVKKVAYKITRVGQLVAQEASKRLNANFGIIDLSLAPTPVMGDSVGHILEEMGLECVGAYGTTACLALLNDAVKKGGIMASSHVGGLSGAFIPVSEDIGMINAVNKGCLKLEKLEAMTAICSVGLDMVAVGGDTPADVLSAMIADECAIGVVNNKTTAVRVIPVYGKNSGSVNFGGLLGTAPIMPINTASPSKFISRGGRIPAPVWANKN
ncbi:MAG TPA: PFL family protein [Firmicutes bacterium]|nr:PFL family protein [Bacillota bacterium]